MRTRIKIHNCVHLIRTLPGLPEDPNNPDDVDTNAEDHCFDDIKYGFLQFPIQLEMYQNQNEKVTHLESYRRKANLARQSQMVSIADTYH